MLTKITWFFLVVASLALVTYALKRDIRHEEGYTRDLRNRVVGARLMKDGISPYFYKWKDGDPIRYYDPMNFDYLAVSTITSSPFLHRLITPFVEMPQALISRIWLTIEYLIWLFMGMYAFRLAGTDLQRQLVVLVSVLFLFTNGWKMHTLLGQSYICMPFFALLFFHFARNTRGILYGLAAGIAANCLVLTKFYAVFFLLPFVFILWHYKTSWKLAFCVPFLLVAIWLAGSSRERGYWQDYGRMAAYYTELDQGHHLIFQQHCSDPHFMQFEGIDRAAADKIEKAEPNMYYTEHGNFFEIVQLIFHWMTPVWLLGLSGLVTTGVLIGAFYLRDRPFQSTDLSRTALFGFSLYMVADLFSPVYRYQYYTVQWIFPLLLAAAAHRSGQKGIYVLIAGLLLNCIHLPFIKMENTIGEYLFMITLLTLSLFPAKSLDLNTK